MSTVIVNSPGGSNGGSSGGNVNKVGKKTDWMMTLALLGGAAVVGYFATTYLSKKFNLGSSSTDELSGLLASPPLGANVNPTPDQLAATAPAQYPTTNTQVPNLSQPPGYLTGPASAYQYSWAPPSLLPSATQPYEHTYNLYGSQYPALNSLASQNINLGGYLNQPPNAFFPQPLGFGQRINYGFAAKKQGEYDHGHRNVSEHDHPFNYEHHKEAKYHSDYEDEELAVEEPYLHEIFGVSEKNADQASFDEMAFNEDETCLSPEEEDIHIHTREVDENDGKWQYAGHGHRHKHDRRDDSFNRYGEKHHSRHHSPDIVGMGNHFHTSLVRDHKGKMLGMEHHKYSY